LKGTVLFLPGFQKRSFNALEKAEAIKLFLENRGWWVEVSNYGHGRPMNLPTSIYLEELRSEFEQIRPKAVVAHSLSGILVRCLIEIERMRGIERLVMLESPHNGVPSWLLRIFGYPNWPVIWEVKKGSKLLAHLNTAPRGEIDTRYCQIGGMLATIAPGIFKMSGAYVKDFPGVTHSGLRTNSMVLEEIARFIER
jgi:hypothetical protein